MSSPVSTLPDLLNAIYFAAVAHGTQKRKGKDALPYIQHPLDVMNRLAQGGTIDLDALKAAVCHDVLEDAPHVPRETAKATIGEAAYNIVLECTDDKALSKVERKKLQLEHAHTASLGARLVKISDKLSNVRCMDVDPPVGWSAAQICGTYMWSLAIVRACGDIHPLYKECIELLQARGIVYESDEQMQRELAAISRSCNGVHHAAPL